MSRQKMKETEISFVTPEETLTVRLDFEGKLQHREQLCSYMQTYDIRNPVTLLNLKSWAKIRGIPCTIKVKGILRLDVWAYRAILLLESMMKEEDRGSVPPKWKS